MTASKEDTGPSDKMAKDEQKPRASYTKVLGVVALYWSVSISMVFLNKNILSGSFSRDQELTIFSAWYQALAAVATIMCISAISPCINLPINIPEVEPHLLFSKEMLFLSTSSVCTMTFNNLMLKNIGVAFYQVARSFTIIFTIILSAIVLKKGLSMRALAACLMVVSGFFVGIDQEDVSGTLSVFGIVYGVLASLSAAICGIMFKKVEGVLNHDSLKLAFYNNVNCSMIFLPLVVSSGQLGSMIHSDLRFQPKFWAILTFTGCLSLAIGWVSALQIKYTSPVAHHLSINAKSVVQTVLAVIVYAESKTVFWWFGNMLVVSGVLFYAFTKMQEDGKKVAEEVPMSTVTVSQENGSMKQKVTTE